MKRFGVSIISLLCCMAAYAEQSPLPIKQDASQITGDVYQAGGNITVNYQKSKDYQQLIAQRDRLREKIKKYSDDPDFPAELAMLEKDIEAFKRDVLKLAEDISKIPLNTERLKQAVSYFEAGDYDKARAVLDIAGITEEQNALLDRQQQLEKQQTDIQSQLDAKAEELVLLAKLTAIDYNLGEQRIPKTREYFEQALKSGRTAKRLFEYAKFLQENNQFKLAEKHYQEALDSLRSLAKDNPQAYLPDLAKTLNNQAVLIMSDTQRRAEAEALYDEALLNYRQLAKDNPQVYLPEVAGTLNNQAALIMSDTQRRAEAEALYGEALTIRRQLAKDNPQVYLPYVALTLNNLGQLITADTQRRSEAEKLLQEALDSYRSLASDNPQVYSPHVAMTLNNLGPLIAADTQRRSEAEKLYQEALDSYRSLASDNPQVYLPDLAGTLGLFGITYLEWELPEKAKPLLKEASDILRPLAKQLPSVFGDNQAALLIMASQADPENIEFICQAMQEASELAKMDIFKAAVTETLQRCNTDTPE